MFWCRNGRIVNVYSLSGHQNCDLSWKITLNTWIVNLHVTCVHFTVVSKKSYSYNKFFHASYINLQGVLSRLASFNGERWARQVWMKRQFYSFGFSKPEALRCSEDDGNFKSIKGAQGKYWILVQYPCEQRCIVIGGLCWILGQ